MDYELKLTERFNSSFSKLNKSVQRRVVLWIEKNLQGFKDPRLLSKSLQGQLNGLWSYRIGNYRLICSIIDQELTVLALEIGHRKDIYNK